MLLNTTNSVQTNAKGFTLGMGGQSMRQVGSVKIEAPVLQEFQLKDGVKVFVGEPITGNQANDIAYSYAEANKARKLEVFKTAVDKAATQKDFVKKDRSLADGETVQERATRYIIGTVMGAINTVPSTFTVAGKHYAYSKISNSKSYDPYDLQDVLTGKKSLGTGEAISSIEDTSGLTSSNMVIVPKDLLQECVTYFVQKLEVKIQGNSLFILGREAVSFTKAEEISNLLSHAKYDLSEINVGF